jgi:hypothetical protein
MIIKEPATVVKRASGIDYDKTKVENEFIIEGKALKRSNPERKQGSAQKINPIKIEQQHIETTKAKHKSKKEFGDKGTIKVRIEDIKTSKEQLK